MQKEMTPDIQIFLTAREFEQARNQVSEISVQRLGFLAAAELIGYEIPDDVPTSVVIGNRREVLPFLKVEDVEVFNASMIAEPEPEGLMLHELEDTNILSFYIDDLTTKHASIGLAAAMQADERQRLREGTVEDIALGYGTASLSFMANYFNAPVPVTVLVATAGTAALVRRRMRHHVKAGYLIAAREAAASHEPIKVVDIDSTEDEREP